MTPKPAPAAPHPDAAALDTGVIAAEWQRLLGEARNADWPEYRALVEAAFEEPVLRELYPYTSHWALSFATGPNVPFATPMFLSVQSPHESRLYTIKKSWNGPTLAEVDSPTAAIAFVLDRVPGFFGPGDVPPPQSDASHRKSTG
ncbi:DUF6193 family natural product biosynthesis protein [Kitasatospora sp. NPDC056651]|uniref:DUF6193 family natural product biosynthesis protein n=1 Tax=Kitasatospora sp. NPDC056651 TaxID=3345892 RepID=UPI0036B4396B